jgi:hypothetical protein
MTSPARFISGIILITVPTIQYGGYFLLTSLMNRTSAYMDNALRQNFFRAGHAHAGDSNSLVDLLVAGLFFGPTLVARVVRADRRADLGDSLLSRVLRLDRSTGRD